MAAPTTTDAYDEYVAGLVHGSIAQVDSWNVGLYNDATDLIVSTDDIADITTEPTGNGYTTNAVTPSVAADVVVGPDATVSVDDQTWGGMTFGATTNVDAYYISAEIQLEGDVAPTEHLLAVGELTSGPYDLSNYSSLTIRDIGITQGQ